MGHATRCIPIIKSLIEADFEPILASDGNALELLKKEFPTLKSYTLPSYNIKYSKSSWNFKLQLLFAIPSVISAVVKERKTINQIIEKEQVVGVISDNRFGVYSSKIPSVYITHQVTVMSGFTTFITSKIHRYFINKYDECWIPDTNESSNLSGKLGHSRFTSKKAKYIGVLSRLQQIESEIKYDLMVLLSGPEPQRSILEKKLLDELIHFKGTVLVVRGVISEVEYISTSKNIKVINYLVSKQLNKAIEESEIIVARSGYSTIMDLAVLGKKAFFIPTPGQNEQEYLAELMLKRKIAPYRNQNDFTINDLMEIENYQGFNSIEYPNKFDLKFLYLF